MGGRSRYSGEAVANDGLIEMFGFGGGIHMAAIGAGRKVDKVGSHSTILIESSDNEFFDIDGEGVEIQGGCSILIKRSPCAGRMGIDKTSMTTQDLRSWGLEEHASRV